MIHKIIKNDNYLLIVGNDIIQLDDHYLDDSNMVCYAITECATFWTHRKKYKKVIAHLPLGQAPILKGVPLLPSLRDDSRCDVDEATERFRKSYSKHDISPFEVSAFAIGYLQAREKYKYTQDDIRKVIKMVAEKCRKSYYMVSDVEIIQSLHQYPAEFECTIVTNCTTDELLDPDNRPEFFPKTITTDQGIQWVGKYL